MYMSKITIFIDGLFGMINMALKIKIVALK